MGFFFPRKKIARIAYQGSEDGSFTPDSTAAFELTI
jgi:hypothetical protein